jgi:N-sulfoglucosamine sulfohydrolase
MNRRRFLAAAAAPAVLAQAPRPRNVLVMIADDLGLHTGAYGDPVAKTPHLDQLASEGVRFTHAFCTTASCSPSRSVMLTGLHNHTNGMYGLAHEAHHFSLLPKVATLPALLQKAGYQTGVIGKLHVTPAGQLPWTLAAEGDGRSGYEMAQRARQFIGAAGNQPWYLHVGYTDPHRGPGPGGFANRPAKPYPHLEVNRFAPADVRVPSFLPDRPEVRRDLAEYYEAANRLDQGVGYLMRVLRETGQLDRTLVIFLSDNGMPFANAKTNLYDAATRLPLIVRAPEQPQRGVATDALASWTDLMPTVLDWAGVEAPYRLPGESWLPRVQNPGPGLRDAVFFSHTFHEVTMYYPMRGVRTRQYKYIRNLFPELAFPLASDLFASPTWQSIRAAGEQSTIGQRPAGLYRHRPAEELYDVIQDPDEVRNLAREPGSQAVLGRLRQAVEDFRRQTQDPWLILENYQPEFGPRA